jgi:membrane associated rhomboid family serine protease
VAITLNLILIGITVLVSWLAWQNPRLLDRLMLWSPAITRKGEVHRLVTYGFVHADGQHLLFNMITLYFFGQLIEQALRPFLGPYGYVLFYLAALVVSVLPSYLEHRNDASYRSLGASGAVSAVLFAFILFEPWALIFVFFIPVPAVIYAALYVAYSVWAERRGRDNINHSAHLWGAGFGVLFCLVMEPRIASRFFARLFDPGFGG